MYKSARKWVSWFIAPDGSLIFWAYRVGMWRQFSFTKKRWIKEKYYINGDRVSRFKWWVIIIFNKWGTV